MRIPYDDLQITEHHQIQQRVDIGKNILPFSAAPHLHIKKQAHTRACDTIGEATVISMNPNLILPVTLILMFLIVAQTLFAAFFILRIASLYYSQIQLAHLLAPFPFWRPVIPLNVALLRLVSFPLARMKNSLRILCHFHLRIVLIMLSTVALVPFGPGTLREAYSQRTRSIDRFHDVVKPFTLVEKFPRKLIHFHWMSKYPWYNGIN